MMMKYSLMHLVALRHLQALVAVTLKLLMTLTCDKLDCLITYVSV